MFSQRYRECVIVGECNGMVWYGIVKFNIPLDTVWVISEMGQ